VASKKESQPSINDIVPPAEQEQMVLQDNIIPVEPPLSNNEDSFNQFTVVHKKEKLATKVLKQGKPALKQTEMKEIKKVKPITSNDHTPASKGPIVLKPEALKQTETKEIKKIKLITSNDHTPDSKGPIVLKPEKPVIQHLKSSMHFSFNPNAIDWKPLNVPDLFPAVKIKHPSLSILESLNKMYMNIYEEKSSSPTLTCYGSTARFLFEQSFCGTKDTKVDSDIDLHLHLPEGLNDETITQWFNILNKNGATILHYIDGRITREDYIQLKFSFKDTPIDLTFSARKLNQILDLPTIVLNPKQDPVGNFCIPKIFYDTQNNVNKTIIFCSDFQYENLFNPRTLSFIWKQIAYLRAAGYSYDRSFVHEMTALQQDLLNQPHIIQQASCLFFGEYFPKNEKFFFMQFRKEPIKISTLDPYILTAMLDQYPAGMVVPSDNNRLRLG
jgi:hypothetical protein